jgi:hypothetical protein
MVENWPPVVPQILCSTGHETRVNSATEDTVNIRVSVYGPNSMAPRSAFINVMASRHGKKIQKQSSSTARQLSAGTKPPLRRAKPRITIAKTGIILSKTSIILSQCYIKYIHHEGTKNTKYLKSYGANLKVSACK